MDSCKLIDAISMRKDFIDEVRLLMRIVLDVGDAAFPPPIDPAAIHGYNRQFAQSMYRYGHHFAPPLRIFLQANMPQHRPAAVVYPFGGGDLISALLAFPDAPELTTISLEQAGDPRRINSITHEDLRRSLCHMKVQIGGTLSVGSNTSKNLSISQRNYLPIQVISFLAGLAVHHYEPVAMYYFSLNDDGSIHYLSDAQIQESSQQGADRLRLSWRRPNFSNAFANVEVQYKRSNNAQAPVQIFRHIGASLHNGRFVHNIPLRQHLVAKGQVSGLVKGASYLLWRDGYSLIRDYMLAHMPFMVSDSTGIPVQYAMAAGFRIKTFGKFNGSCLRTHANHNEALRTLWRINPYIHMPVRFGYVDCDNQAHMMFSIREDVE